MGTWSDKHKPKTIRRAEARRGTEKVDGDASRDSPMRTSALPDREKGALLARRLLYTKGSAANENAS